VKGSDASGLGYAVETRPGCLDIERLSSDALTAPERDHLSGCVRCQTEQALWREFDGAQPSADEGAAVEWIVAELARRRRPSGSSAGSRQFVWLRPPVRVWASALAAVVVATAVGYVAWDREPTVRAPQGAEQNYRAANLQLVSPVGDVAAAPQRLEWAVVAGAVSYDVELLEVDRTVRWRTATATAGMEIPPEVAGIMLPRKTVLWQVRARDLSNRVIAESGLQRFRVQSTSSKE
jgi:hypothetical protein